MAYPTLAEIKTYLGVTGTEDDDWLQLTLDAVIDSVEGYCQRQFELQADVASWIQCDPQADFYVYRYPIVSVESMTVDDAEIAETDIKIDALLGRVIPAYQRTGDVVLNYTGGYDPVPAAVTYVINESMKDAYAGKDVSGNVGAVKSERIDGVATIQYDVSSADSGGSGGSADNAPPLIANYADMLGPYLSDASIGGVV